MLRITALSDDGRTVRLKVEGRLVGDWVSALDQACGSCLSQQKTIILDLSEVSFLDRRGTKALKALLKERVRIVRASLLVQALLGREPAGEIKHEE